MKGVFLHHKDAVKFIKNDLMIYITDPEMDDVYVGKLKHRLQKLMDGKCDHVKLGQGHSIFIKEMEIPK